MELWGQRNVDFFFYLIMCEHFQLSFSFHLSHTYMFIHSFLHYIYFIYNVRCVAFLTPNNINKSYSCKSPIHYWENKPQRA